MLDRFLRRGKYCRLRHGQGPGNRFSSRRRLPCADAARDARRVLLHELVSTTGLLPSLVERGCPSSPGAGTHSPTASPGCSAPCPPPAPRALVETAGQWSFSGHPEDRQRRRRGESVGFAVYGIVFRTLLPARARSAAWRDLVRGCTCKLEARGEIRGEGFRRRASGRRAVRRAGCRVGEGCGQCEISRELEELVVLGAADRQPRRGPNARGARCGDPSATVILFRDGLPVAAVEGRAVAPTRRLRSLHFEIETLAGAPFLRHPPGPPYPHGDAAGTSRLERARDRMRNFPPEPDPALAHFAVIDRGRSETQRATRSIDWRREKKVSPYVLVEALMPGGTPDRARHVALPEQGTLAEMARFPGALPRRPVAERE